MRMWAVVVEVLAVGLCRSDYHGWHGTDPDIVCPHVGGHEFVGRVVAVGVASCLVGTFALLAPLLMIRDRRVRAAGRSR